MLPDLMMQDWTDLFQGRFCFQICGDFLEDGSEGLGGIGG